MHKNHMAQKIFFHIMYTVRVSASLFSFIIFVNKSSVIVLNVTKKKEGGFLPSREEEAEFTKNYNTTT